MASLLDIKYDKITRALSQGNYDSKYLCKQSKVYVRELTQSKDLITLSFDDSIEEKRYTDESQVSGQKIKKKEPNCCLKIIRF